VRVSSDFKFHVYSGKISKCDDYQDIVVLVDKGRRVRVWNTNNRYEKDGVRFYDLTPGMAVELVVPRVGACVDNIMLCEPGGCP
jgi:hypothetical protein